LKRHDGYFDSGAPVRKVQQSTLGPAARNFFYSLPPFVCTLPLSRHPVSGFNFKWHAR
jgi:hypothetical protein